MTNNCGTFRSLLRHSNYLLLHLHQGAAQQSAIHLLSYTWAHRCLQLTRVTKSEKGDKPCRPFHLGHGWDSNMHASQHASTKQYPSLHIASVHPQQYRYLHFFISYLAVRGVCLTVRSHQKRQDHRSHSGSHTFSVWGSVSLQQAAARSLAGHLERWRF